MLQNEASAVKVMSLSISLEPLWKLSYFLDAHFKSIMICRRFNAMLLCFWHFILVHSEGNEAREKNRDIWRHAELFPLFLFLYHYFLHLASVFVSPAMKQSNAYIQSCGGFVFIQSTSSLEHTVLKENGFVSGFCWHWENQTVTNHLKLVLWLWHTFFIHLTQVWIGWI